jgi:hypothetical protein
MYVLLALIVITGLVFRLAGLFRARTLPRVVEQRPGLSTRIHTLWRKHISLPLVLHYRNQSRLGWVQVPRRLPALLIIAYMLINLVFVLICYDLFDDNLYWRHEIAVRSVQVAVILRIYALTETFSMKHRLNAGATSRTEPVCSGRLILGPDR